MRIPSATRIPSSPQQVTNFSSDCQAPQSPFRHPRRALHRLRHPAMVVVHICSTRCEPARNQDPVRRPHHLVQAWEKRPALHPVATASPDSGRTSWSRARRRCRIPQARLHTPSSSQPASNNAFASSFLPPNVSARSVGEVTRSRTVYTHTFAPRKMPSLPRKACVKMRRTVFSQSAPHRRGVRRATRRRTGVSMFRLPKPESQKRPRIAAGRRRSGCRRLYFTGRIISRFDRNAKLA